MGLGDACCVCWCCVCWCCLGWLLALQAKVERSTVARSAMLSLSTSAAVNHTATAAQPHSPLHPPSTRPMLPANQHHALWQRGHADRRRMAPCAVQSSPATSWKGFLCCCCRWALSSPAGRLAWVAFSEAACLALAAGVCAAAMPDAAFLAPMMGPHLRPWMGLCDGWRAVLDSAVCAGHGIAAGDGHTPLRHCKQRLRKAAAG